MIPVAENVGSRLRLSEVLGAMSHALDMTEGLPPGHSARAAFIALRVADEIGMAPDARRDLFYAVLLKDAGCSSNAARLCEIYQADDLELKRDFKTVGPKLADTLKYVLSHTAPDRGFAARAAAILKIMGTASTLVTDLVATRCQRGADIARRLHFSEDVAGAIAALDEHWDGGGKPFGLQGVEVPLYARIGLLAQIVEVFYAAGGREAAIAEVRLRAGSWFDPYVVAAVLRCSTDEALWTALGGEAEALAVAEADAWETIEVDDDYLDDLAEAFADVVDAKTPYTAGHSDRVAEIADAIAAELGFDTARRRRLRRAALLHDVGKLGVSNKVLDKPGRLDADEWVSVRSHPAKSEAILSRISVFTDAARIGGAHHERLDGKGYPRGLAGAEIDLETRIVTVADVFDALTADRPYRSAMPVSKALSLIEAEVASAFDADCVDALRRSLLAEASMLAA